MFGGKIEPAASTSLRRWEVGVARSMGLLRHDHGGSARSHLRSWLSGLALGVYEFSGVSYRDRARPRRLGRAT